MGKTERFKDWHIETIEKMAMKAHGQLKSGKQFFLTPHHPAHQTFTAQEHAEAAHMLRDEGTRYWQQGHDQDDPFGINHGRSLMIASKGHAQQAKAKGLPKHNAPKR